MRRGENCYALLNDNKVPFAKMWSSALVSKPADWGPHIDITGNFFAPPESTSDYQPPAELINWLAKGDSPIFIGFGSMVIADTATLVKTFCYVSAVNSAAAADVAVTSLSAHCEATSTTNSHCKNITVPLLVSHTVLYTSIAVSWVITFAHFAHPHTV
eukprot:16980-Heterococcus_DN1.PRE.2